jgi:site-specific recombinase XerD
MKIGEKIMNMYNEFKNYQPERYDKLKLGDGVVRKAIHNQVDEYLDFCANTRKMSRMTMHAKELSLRYLIGESGCNDLREFDNEMFDRFVKAELARKVSARTINGRTDHVVAMVRYFREMGMEIPIKLPLVFKLKEQPPRRVCYSRKEVQKVLNRCNSELAWLLIKISFDTGMRISELTNLTVEEIHGRRINFVGKGSKEREVYITQECAERLGHYMQKNGIHEGRIWLNDWGYPTSTDTIRRVMRGAFERCGFDNFYPHALRHSFGSDIQRQGADVMVIKEMMGHANVATTQRYLHSLDGQLLMLFNTYR